MDYCVAIETKTEKSRLLSQMIWMDKNIDLLAKDYGNNLCSVGPNATVEVAQNTLLSSYYHARSSDANPTPHLCPPGEKSWCWVQRAKFRNEVLASHSTKNLYLSRRDAVLCKRIFLVYCDLTATDFLERCIKQRTQNANESLHSKLWLKCPKVKHCSLARVKFATADTCLKHNLGQCKGNLLANLNFLTDDAVENLQKLDRQSKSALPYKRRSRSVGGGEGPHDYEAGAYKLFFLPPFSLTLDFTDYSIGI